MGLIGVNLLLDFQLTIDLKKGVIVLNRCDKSGNAIHQKSSSDRVPAIKMPIQIVNNTIAVETSINNQSMLFAFDTGAETNVLDAKVFRKMMEEIIILRRSVMIGTAGGSAETLVGLIKVTNIGGKDFHKMRTIITKMESLGEAYGYEINGMLGYDFFARGIVKINFVKKELTMDLY